jgi:hypothetical protein
MANTVRIPYSNTSGNVPSTLGNGVLGINQASGAIYYRNSSGVVTQFSSAATLADGSVTTAKLADPLVYDCGAYAAIVPAAPTGLTVTPTTGQAALAWTAPTNTGGAAITDYLIQYSSNAGSSYTTFSHTASTAASATITGLVTGSYLFRIAAVNSAGTGPYITSSSTGITGASGGATLSSFNATWNAISFTGSGTSASPYTKANYPTNMAGAQGTAATAGTIRITGQMYSDAGVDIYKNGSATYTIADAYAGGGGNYTLNATITVASGDVIRIGVSTDDYYTIPATALNVWGQ